MILAARDQQCLAEMLIIASALSVQDPRDRPMQEREAAEAAHAKFADDKSEFISFLKLWRWYGEQVQHKGSQRKLVALLRQNFLSPIRLREWHDVHTQLSALVGEQGWRVNQTEATFEQLHLALLSACWAISASRATRAATTRARARSASISTRLAPGEESGALGGRGRAGGNHPAVRALRGAHRADLAGTGGRAPAAQELVGPALGKEGRAGGRQRARHAVRPDHLYRPAHPLRPGHPSHARELFIRQALVPGEIDTRLAFVAHNRKLIAGIEKLEHQTRRPDILVDDELIYAFYDRQLPADISQTATLEKWVSGLDKAAAAKLMLTRDELMRHEAAGVTTEVFPRRSSGRA